MHILEHLYGVSIKMRNKAVSGAKIYPHRMLARRTLVRLRARLADLHEHHIQRLPTRAASSSLER